MAVPGRLRSHRPRSGPAGDTSGAAGHAVGGRQGREHHGLPLRERDRGGRRGGRSRQHGPDHPRGRRRGIPATAPRRSTKPRAVGARVGPRRTALVGPAAPGPGAR
ncbi:hypothetical protein E6R62_25115 [Streptomyces sp. A1136]|nr:hypothetical protein E6R62_25115 [Streptomyces sp. A1136]